jgi:hypothetical protein
VNRKQLQDALTMATDSTMPTWALSLVVSLVAAIFRLKGTIRALRVRDADELISAAAAMTHARHELHRALGLSSDPDSYSLPGLVDTVREHERRYQASMAAWVTLRDAFDTPGACNWEEVAQAGIRLRREARASAEDAIAARDAIRSALGIPEDHEYTLDALIEKVREQVSSAVNTRKELGVVLGFRTAEPMPWRNLIDYAEQLRKELMTGGRTGG